MAEITTHNKKKLLLINPVNSIRKGFLMRNLSTFPPLALAIIAALTPKDWDVTIQDENIKPFEFEDADLVGLTSFTASANRAYEIAGFYREKGIKTVMGGIHASMLPDEALAFVDSFVIGEAESIWVKLISDFKKRGIANQVFWRIASYGRVSFAASRIIE